MYTDNINIFTKSQVFVRFNELGRLYLPGIADSTKFLYEVAGCAYPESVILRPCYLNVFKYFAGFNENAKSAYTTSRKSFGIVFVNAVLFISVSFSP